MYQSGCCCLVLPEESRSNCDDEDLERSLKVHSIKGSPVRSLVLELDCCGPDIGTADVASKTGEILEACCFLSPTRSKNDKP